MIIFYDCDDHVHRCWCSYWYFCFNHYYFVIAYIMYSFLLKCLMVLLLLLLMFIFVCLFGRVCFEDWSWLCIVCMLFTSLQAIHSPKPLWRPSWCEEHSTPEKLRNPQKHRERFLGQRQLLAISEVYFGCDYVKHSGKKWVNPPGEDSSNTFQIDQILMTVIIPTTYPNRFGSSNPKNALVKGQIVLQSCGPRWAFCFDQYQTPSTAAGQEKAFAGWLNHKWCQEPDALCKHGFSQVMEWDIQLHVYLLALTSCLLVCLFAFAFAFAFALFVWSFFSFVCLFVWMFWCLIVWLLACFLACFSGMFMSLLYLLACLFPFLCLLLCLFVVVLWFIWLFSQFCRFVSCSKCTYVFSTKPMNTLCFRSCEIGQYVSFQPKPFKTNEKTYIHCKVSYIVKFI